MTDCDTFIKFWNSALLFSVRRNSKKDSSNYFNPIIPNKLPTTFCLVQFQHPTGKRTPTDAELHYTEPQEPKVKSEVILTMKSKAISNAN